MGYIAGPTSMNSMSAINFKQLLLEERRKKTQQGSSSSSGSLDTPKSSTRISSNLCSSISCDYGKIHFKSFCEGTQFCLENFRLNTHLPTLYYVPDIMDEETEKELVTCVEKEGSERNMWQVLRTRKLQLHGKVPTSPHLSTVTSSSESALPAWLRHIADMLSANGVFPCDIYPNNVLINRYEKDQGIMHHTDGPSYSSYVVIFSLLSDCILTFKPKLATEDIGIKSDDDVLSIMLRRRSMFIFKDALYENYLHGIHPENVHVVGSYAPCVNISEANCVEGDMIERESRISITFRRVVSE